MEDKKPRVLDILRLMIALMVLICSAFAITLFIVAAITLLADNYKDEVNGVIFIYIIIIILGLLAYLFVAIKWIKRYNKTKNISLIQRNASIGGPIVKGVVFAIFLNYASIPFVVYWGLNLIEAIMRKNLAEKLKGSKPEPEFKTNETHPIDDPNRCKYCGKEVDYRYARFCEHCGAEIEYRK